MAPTTAEQIVAWYTKYRPGVFGRFEELGPYGDMVAVEIVPAPPPRPSPYANAYSQLAALQQQAYLQNALANRNIRPTTLGDLLGMNNGRSF